MTTSWKDRLRELLLTLRPMTAYGVVGSRDVDQARYRAALDEALAMLAAGGALPAPALRPVGTIEHNYSTEKERVDGIRADLDVGGLPVGTKLYALSDGVPASDSETKPRFLEGYTLGCGMDEGKGSIYD